MHVSLSPGFGLDGGKGEVCLLCYPVLVHVDSITFYPLRLADDPLRRREVVVMRMVHRRWRRCHTIGPTVPNDVTSGAGLDSASP